MTMKRISDGEKNEEEVGRAWKIARKGDFVATTTLALCSRVPSENWRSSLTVRLSLFGSRPISNPPLTQQLPKI
jgi:hypothetical protein